MDDLSLSDTTADDIETHNSTTKQPSKQPASAQQPPKTPANQSQKKGNTKAQDAPKQAAPDDSPRDAALRAELESIRRTNQVIEGVTSSLEKAKSNMSVRVQPLSANSTRPKIPRPY